MSLSPVWRRIYSNQDEANAAEDREILVYDLWRNWAAESAVADTERSLRREAVRTGEASRGHSPSRIAVVFWALVGAILAIALAIALGWGRG